MSDDTVHMRHALALAARGLGRTGRVPSVGCVLVSPDGRIVGRGRTDESGRPHAEAAALAQAGRQARGATAYVTLEPCAHQGRNGGPCSDALIAAGIARVVIAAVDPDPRTNGQGIAKLRAAGIEVVTGVLEREVKEQLAGFFLRQTQNRPLVTLKVAQSLDGKTATASGESQWITGPAARRFGHLLRAEHDAILVGSGTVLADDPELTCRIAGLEQWSPIAIVLDSRLRTPPAAKRARAGTLIFTVAEGSKALTATGAEIVRVPPGAQGRVDIAALLTELSVRGITRLLVEGGATVAASFLDAGFADRLEIFTAPIVLGAAGLGAIAPLAAQSLAAMPQFRRVETRSLGPDLLESFVRKA